MLTQAETDEMREDFNASLPDRAKVFRKHVVSDGQGGETEVNPPDLIYGGPARLSPIPAWRSSEAVTGGQLIAATGWYITLEALVTVYGEDRIEIRFTETGQLRTFEVAGVMDSRTYQLGTRVLATEIT